MSALTTQAHCRLHQIAVLSFFNAYRYLKANRSKSPRAHKCARGVQRVKNTLEYEPYLDLPPYLRVPLARFRCSAHGLKIETGRYTVPTPTPVEERQCDLCGVLEDEQHFLINCPLLSRQKLFQHCSKILPPFEHKSPTDKFLFIMTSTDSKLLPLLAHTVQQGFLSRAPHCESIH